MAIDKVGDESEARGWIWAALFVGMGLIGVADWLYSSMTELHRLMSGIGFFLLAPQAFLHPLRFNKPLLPQFKSKPRTARPTDWLAIAGIIMLVLGLLIRWV